jgi:hypothetical protein
VWLEIRILAFSAYLTSFSFDDDSLFLGGLGFVLPLGNGILMKMWQHSVG